MGTKDGILCRGCGQLFRSFSDICPAAVPDPEQEADQGQAPEDPEPKKPAEPAEEKPKRGRKKKGE